MNAKIIVEALLFLIPLGALIILVIVPLVTGKNKTYWLAAVGDIGFNEKMKEKWKDNYNERKHVLTVFKKDFPREYWNGVLLRIIFVAVIVLVAFSVYQKIK